MENKTWEEIRGALISSSNNKTTKYWLDQTQASSSEKGVVTISVPSVFIKDSFEKKFGKNIKEELVYLLKRDNYKSLDQAVGKLNK